MGFRRAVVPAGTFEIGTTLSDPDLAVLEVPDVLTAVGVVLTRGRISGVPTPGIRRISATRSARPTSMRESRNRLHSTAQAKEADASSAR